MNCNVRRLFVEKKPGFNTEAKKLLNDFKMNLKISKLKNVRIVNRYDVENISYEDFSKCIYSVFAENNQDNVFFENMDIDNMQYRRLAVEYLPGQYDQRADSAIQCIQIITGLEDIIVKFAKIIFLEGDLSDYDYEKIKSYYINPVDSREASFEKPLTLNENFREASDVEVVENFIDKTQEEIHEYKNKENLAMSFEDLLFCQDYFKNTEKRNPTITEIKVIDTYWSDHCRHTTFSTLLENIKFDEGKISKEIENTYKIYLNSRKFVYENNKRDITLMDLATIGAKELKKQGLLEDLEISDEINACSIVIDVETDEGNEEWLLMFKNETHNHPTEIEPFGGAATCLGGAIRDPLSGRAYVYQAMRVTGSADPRQNIENTMAGKLPQRKISTDASNGYSSYGNQIGLATGHVTEVYHPGYVAKRMEVGAVIAAAPRENVKREKPQKGDVVILLGGRTGRDGIGGATGSSKEHTEESILLCGSEVQKGNAPTERKIQRLFRNKNVSKLIKKCNDFGAGGVCVAIGELADSLNINLDFVTKKYDGLDGTELAISESQERMAVVVKKEDAELFNKLAHEENLESFVVAEVTDDKRLKMMWRGKVILDISREFLDTNGVKQKANIYVKEPIGIKKNYIFEKIDDHMVTDPSEYKQEIKKLWIDSLKNLNVACQKGMVEKFDSTIGTGTVCMPFGGKSQLTPTEAMVAKIPSLTKNINTCSIMSFGFDPYISSDSPYHGAMYAVVHSVAKIVSMGGNYKNIRLSFQEYFEKLNKDEYKWGKPFVALLGAFKASHELKIPAIGGKDSMSGTFKDLDVPPTLISFAVATSSVKDIISPEFKKANNKVILIEIKNDENKIFDFDDMKIKYDLINEAIKNKSIVSAHTVGIGGIASSISKMCLGNEIGFKFCEKFINEESTSNLFDLNYGSIVIEIEEDSWLENVQYKLIGYTSEHKKIEITKNEFISLEEIKNSWIEPLNNIYPIKKDVEFTFEKEDKKDKLEKDQSKIDLYAYTKGNKIKRILSPIAKPKVFIPVFPGTNCEYDTKRAFEKAGAEVEIFVFKNLNSQDVKDSINQMNKSIRQSQIIAMPGGFSAGDEPDGSGKFIAAVFRNELLKDSVMDLIKNRDGLMIGICNGFQALIKLGLLPFGEIKDIKEDYPTLTYNHIGRHISCFAKTKIVSNLSPWLNKCKINDVYNVALSHGEGRFVADEKWIQFLKENGQIACQYVDENNNPTYDGSFNPNGSIEAIECITSLDGRILGKMGHSERVNEDICINIDGQKDQRIFEAGVEYFK